MLNRATTLSIDPTSETGRLLEQAFAAARQEHGVRQEFPPEVLDEVAASMDAPDLPDRDETTVPFITIDPPGSMDLDQAMFIERDGDGYRVRYAIADVMAFLVEGGALDEETRARGMTIYCPDLRVPLHPPVLSEGAASLLPGVERPAYIWDMRLDREGTRDTAELYRARVKSVRRYTYQEVQNLVDEGAGEDTLMLLQEVGELRIERETARGGASLPMPEQEVELDDDGNYVLQLRPLLPAEDWNAQISLLTGIVAAQIMLEGGVGILRTMPVPEQGAVARFRREARALGSEWPKDLPYGEFLRSLDKSDPAHLAIVHAATALFRGAGYTAFDGDLPPEADRIQAAIAAPYTHVTAPLRRLVDRFALAVCQALTCGEDVPDWARSTLSSLPDLMAEADRRAKAVERSCVSAVEAAVLVDQIGQDLDAVVVDGHPKGVVVQLLDPPVSATVKGTAELGASVEVHVEGADVLAGKVSLRVVGP
ncbi:MAG: RNB domain-containing ribonuclease [Ornithinimicrobium sp.]|uniref:RNB domain-containing ribonuclease n=1 Tax=Ornithinimicrobium sp. TaxID=1977084 RepID=UPI0026DF63D6|nr:RNB domain-containing ribonuclease [Ornithinimicrobium sp.]MDO5739517.1 RNB domain-containing ribonuclease [Ornithinimicrobium sp.]